ILEHERKLCHEVLEVVDDECGHPAECIKFARFEQRLGRGHIPQKACGLPACGLEKVQHLPIDLDGRTRIREDDESNEISPGYQWNDQPRCLRIPKPFWQDEVRIPGPRRRVFLEIDHPTRACEKSCE